MIRLTHNPCWFFILRISLGPILQQSILDVHLVLTLNPIPCFSTSSWLCLMTCLLCLWLILCLMSYRGGGWERRSVEKTFYVMVILSTMRAATDQWSSSVEKMGQVIKGWSLKQRSGPLKSRNDFYENPLVLGYCQFRNNSLKLFLLSKSYPLKTSNIPAHTHRQALENRILFVLNVKIFIQKVW